ncbi:hypothetical protein ACA910_016877 [Epithemia clementina (nom. ined.)]
MEKKRSSSTTTTTEKEQVLTAAELVRRQRQEKRKKLATNVEEEPVALKKRRQQEKQLLKAEAENAIDIDEEIARLEAELAKDDDEDSSVDDDVDDDESSSSESNINKLEEDMEQQSFVAGTDGIVCLSALKDERIESLPVEYLPQAPKNASARKAKTKKQVPTAAPSGLEKAVQEVLSGYVPRSAERMPFYCRVCQKQYSSETEFFEHRKTQFHLVAAEAERKASYCKLCRKQLTSPAQLKEHLKSKPHKERLQRVSSSSSSNAARGNNQNDARGGRRDQTSSASNRQWT